MAHEQDAMGDQQLSSLLKKTVEEVFAGAPTVVRALGEPRLEAVDVQGVAVKGTPASIAHRPGSNFSG